MADTGSVSVDSIPVSTPSTSDQKDDVKGAAAPQAEEHPKVAELKKYMNKQTKVHIKDGRVFCGRLGCFDKQKNVLLNETEEIRPITSNGKEEKRILGAIMIPYEYITQILVDENDTSADAKPPSSTSTSNPSATPSSASTAPTKKPESQETENSSSNTKAS